MRTLWFDITNTPHVHFLLPIMERYRAHSNIIVSVRDYSETIALARKQLRLDPVVVGRHGGKSKIKKAARLVARLGMLGSKIDTFDVALSCGGIESCLIAGTRRKIAVVFDDNDVSPNWMYSRFADHVFFPKAVPLHGLLKQGFESANLHRYDGYKEEMYLADYVPDQDFVRNLPFRDYVVVRPENRMANYVHDGLQSIVPPLLRALSRSGFNVLYLPRFESEHRYAYGVGGVFIPRNVINGADACFFSKAVLSGAGSLTREAACLGKPAVSFYPGRRLLAVDRQMIRDKWLIHSRDPDQIVDCVRHSRPRAFDRGRSKKVQDAVFAQLDEIIL